MIPYLTNTASTQTVFHINRNNRLLNQSINALATGSRVNSDTGRSAEKAMAVSVQKDNSAYAKAQQTANNGISLLQTADSALNSMSNVLTQMYELTQQAADTTISAAQRTDLDTEFDELKLEINRISNSTEFNGIKLLDGTLNSDLLVGINNNANDKINITIADVDASQLGSGTMLDQVTISANAAQAQNMLKFVNAAINDINSRRATVGAKITRFTETTDYLSSRITYGDDYRSRIEDVDVASESARMTKLQVIMQSGVSVLAQANSFPGMALTLLS